MAEQEEKPVDAVPIKDMLDDLYGTLVSWHSGKVPDEVAGRIAMKVGRALASPRTCWCASDKMCCKAHGRHVSPHRNCLMR